ncbi:hypothetical protein Poly30_56480 [Planctomycetes bacterium Poly30]|uniref:Uncharacterized protein n=1 Tax=Saltatorellus ferox TaxID=2528018 RepID=A0A518F168_9BACT|nr:hypothetical protein Poly30_56480 [Planctomycetes bacterium Poly30]
MSQPQPASEDNVSSTTHFRLVPEESVSGQTPAQDPRVPSMMSAALLVPEAEFAARAVGMPSDARLACAEIPLIASLARIRSEADAAIALTGVIETLARRFQVQLPCGALHDGMIGFILPSKVNLADVARTIDESLLGQVRATDLQGALKVRMEAQVTPMAPL